MNKPKDIVYEWRVVDKDGEEFVSQKSGDITAWILQDDDLKSDLEAIYRDVREGPFREEDLDRYIDNECWDYAKEHGYKINVRVVWGTPDALAEKRKYLKEKFDKEMAHLPSVSKLRELHDQITQIDRLTGTRIDE